jgi:hypothetical protein
MAAKIFDDLLLKGIRSGQVPARTQSARDWYRAQAKSVSRTTFSNEIQLVREMGTERYETRFRIGHMYMFTYQPKHRDTLPYYDRFPLIFPINKAKGGFLGINFHYLPLQLRAKLMDSLYEVSSNNRFDETTKMKVSYGILNGASKYKEFKPTVKHYLTSQIRGRLVYVNPAEWDIALFLPLEKFEKATKTQVWTDSRKIIRGTK